MMSLPFVKVLPTTFTAPMGQVMIDWAFYEMRLQDLVYTALKITTAQGRLSIKSMPAMSMYELAVDLFALEGIKLPQANLHIFRELASRRNLLAHGVWMQGENGFFLRDLTGTTSNGTKKVKRKVLPAGVPIIPEDIKHVSEQIQKATSDIEQLILDVLKQRSSFQKTHPE